MAAVNQPYVTATLVPDSSVTSIDAPRVLLVGVVPVDEETAIQVAFGDESTLLVQNYQNATPDQLTALFGDGCMMRERFLAAQQASAGLVPIDLLLVKEDVIELTAATTTITLTEGVVGDAKGFLKLSVADSRKYSASVNLETFPTIAEISAEIAAQLTVADAPFTAEAALGVVTLTWRDFFVTESTPIHVSLPFGSIFSAVVSVSATNEPNGVIDSSLFDVIGDIRYSHILWPDYYASSNAVVTEFLDGRFNTFNDVLSGAAWTALAAEDVTQAIAATASLNSQSIIVVASHKINGLFGASIGADKKRLPDADIAFLATAHARMLTTDADLTDLGFIAEGLKDYRGGIHMASFPAHNIVIAGTEPSNPRWYFRYDEQSLLNDSNVSTYGVNRSGTVTVSGNLLTMWKTDSAGNVNLTWKQAEFLYTSMAIREYMDSAARIKFANQRMTGGDTVIGYSMVNQASVEEWTLSQYRLLGDLALTVKGADADKAFVRDLTVTLQPALTRIDTVATYPIVTHVGVANFTIRTSTNYTA